jgi:hypothetical protein
MTDMNFAHGIALFRQFRENIIVFRRVVWRPADFHSGMFLYRRFAGFDQVLPSTGLRSPGLTGIDNAGGRPSGLARNSIPFIFNMALFTRVSISGRQVLCGGSIQDLFM